MLSHYAWPSYSILIALFNKILPGSLLVSAHVLNLLLQTLLITTFVRLSQRLHGGRRIAWLAALTLLAHPPFNEMRAMLIRDFGFLAFALLSLEFLLLLRDTGRWQHAALWVLSICLATAFRLEALVVAAFAPLALWNSGNHRKVLLLYALLLALAAIAGFVCAALQVDLLAQMQSAWRYYLPGLLDLPNLVSHASQGLMQQLFTPDNFPGNRTGQGLIILLFAYGYSVLAIVARALTIPLSVLLLHALWRGWLRPADGWRGPLSVYALCSLLSLLTFVSIMHFLTERYAMLLCLLLLLLVPGVLNRWIDHAQAQHSKQRYLNVAWIFMIYFFTDSLVSFGHSSAYMQQALTWLQTSDTATNMLVTNHPFLAYGSGRVRDYDNSDMTVSDALARIESGGTLALKLTVADNDGRAMLERDQRLTLVQKFANKRGDEVRIYRAH